MSFRPVATATISGRRWKIGFGFAGTTKGKPDDGSTCEKGRRIVIRASRHGRTRSLEEVVAHELLHASAPWANEAFCEEFGSLYCRVLRKMRAAEDHAMP